MNAIVTGLGGLLMWVLFTTPIWVSVVGAYAIARRFGLIPGIAALTATGFVPKIQWQIFYGHNQSFWPLNPDRQAFDSSRLPVLVAIWAGYVLVALIILATRRKVKPA